MRSPFTTELGSPITPDRAGEVKREVRAWLTGLYRICEQAPPEEWTRLIYRELTRPPSLVATEGRRDVSRESAGLIGSYAGFFKELLRDRIFQARERAEGEDEKTVLDVTDALVHGVADEFALPEPLEIREDERPQFATWQKLRQLPGLTWIEEEGRQFVEVENSRGQKSRIAVPQTEQVLHKGGPPRIFLKLLAGANFDLLDAEIPLNDVDVVVCGDLAKAREEALFLGADPEGIEQVESFRRMQQLFSMRDINLNQCFLGKNGLHFTERALRAATTGRIEISSRGRSLYGSEVFYYENKQLLKARGIMRLLKFVAEGKAKDFSMSQLNTHVSLGIYWLFLVRKFAKKKNFPDLVERLQFLGDQAQVPQEYQSIIEHLDAIHERFPFFEFDGGNLNDVDVMRWLIKKAIRVVDKHAQASIHAPVKSFLPDGLPGGMIDISMDGFRSHPEAQERFTQEWPAFLERCRSRNEVFRAKNLPKPLFVEDDDNLNG